jgi:hypothetical protein
LLGPDTDEDVLVPPVEEEFEVDMLVDFDLLVDAELASELELAVELDVEVKIGLGFGVGTGFGVGVGGGQADAIEVENNKANKNSLFIINFSFI